MEENAQEKKVNEKARFYLLEKLKAHVLIIPNGFKNGLFKSELNESVSGRFYWFEELDGNKVRIFLSEIHDIEDYKERDELK